MVTKVVSKQSRVGMSYFSIRSTLKRSC